MSPAAKIVCFLTGEEKSISANVTFVIRAEGECYKHIHRNRHFSLVANDNFYNKGEKPVFCSLSNGGKVCFSSLWCEKVIFENFLKLSEIKKS